MISHHHKLVFVHVPKCAGMAVEHALGGLPFPQREEQHFSGHQYRRYHRDVWDSYHRFAVVRDPLARAWSYVRFYRRWDAVWRRHLGGVSSDDLLRDLLMSSSLLTSRTAAGMLTGEEEVLRQEELATAWPAFAARHGLPAELPERNAAPQATHAAEMRPATQLMVAALFQADFTRFGYPLPDLDLASLPLEEQGPVCWARLRAWALRFSTATLPAQREEALAALEAWVVALPEEAWQRRWRAMVERRPPVFGGTELVSWTEEVHDEVRVALGKPSWAPWRP